MKFQVALDLRAEGVERIQRVRLLNGALQFDEAEGGGGDADGRNNGQRNVPEMNLHRSLYPSSPGRCPSTRAALTTRHSGISSEAASMRPMAAGTLKTNLQAAASELSVRRITPSSP